ncbi:PqqD family peptide modification chaperone [Streptomyces sp. NPDC046887]|uniref:PqqD family peptide modification chaperone n=1 Tax=Streptomyces sp. NPDC046887 TaxID=3155472 RepID=UPI0034059D78
MLSVAPGVYHAGTEQGTAILDTRTGQWLSLPPAAAQVWREALRLGSVDGLADRIAVPAGLDPAATRAAVAKCVADLLERGVLIDVARPAVRRRRRWWR